GVCQNPGARPGRRTDLHHGSQRPPRPAASEGPSPLHGAVPQPKLEGLIPMSLDEEYPKLFRQYSTRIEELLKQVPELPAEEREAIADAVGAMADRAHELEEIVHRLLNEPHTPAEIGELLIAFELTTEQIRGMSDIIDSKLYAIGDRLKGETSVYDP